MKWIPINDKEEKLICYRLFFGDLGHLQIEKFGRKWNLMAPYNRIKLCSTLKEAKTLGKIYLQRELTAMLKMI